MAERGQKWSTKTMPTTTATETKFLFSSPLFKNSKAQQFIWFIEWRANFMAMLAFGHFFPTDFRLCFCFFALYYRNCIGKSKSLCVPSVFRCENYGFFSRWNLCVYLRWKCIKSLTTQRRHRWWWRWCWCRYSVRLHALCTRIHI